MCASFRKRRIPDLMSAILKHICTKSLLHVDIFLVIAVVARSYFIVTSPDCFFLMLILIKSDILLVMFSYCTVPLSRHSLDKLHITSVNNNNNNVCAGTGASPNLGSWICSQKQCPKWRTSPSQTPR